MHKITAPNTDKIHSILGTLSITIKQNENLLHMQDLLDFDEMQLTTVNNSIFPINILHYDFYDHDNKQELLIYFKMDIESLNSKDAKLELDDKFEEGNLLDLSQIEVKDLMKNFYKCRVLNHTLDFDFDTYQ